MPVWANLLVRLQMFCCKLRGVKVISLEFCLETKQHCKRFQLSQSKISSRNQVMNEHLNQRNYFNALKGDWQKIGAGQDTMVVWIDKRKTRLFDESSTWETGNWLRWITPEGKTACSRFLRLLCNNVVFGDSVWLATKRISLDCSNEVTNQLIIATVLMLNNS